MRDWLVEIIDQTALGEYHAQTSLSCGKRFGLIAVDNAVEYMLVAYVETYKRLVGKKQDGISHKEWEDIKGRFPKLLEFVVGLEPALSALELEIMQYHDFRNALYHSGKPITTSSERVSNHAKLARKVLFVLFQQEITDEEWNDVLDRISSVIGKSKISTELRRQVAYSEPDGILKFSANGEVVPSVLTWGETTSPHNLL